MAGLTVPRKPPRGCFCPSHVSRGTLWVRLGRSLVHALPFPAPAGQPPRRTREQLVATVCCSARSLRRSLSLSSLTGRVRPTTDLPQRCPRTAAGNVPGKEQRVLLCYKECQPGIPKLALICPKVTLSRVKTFWDEAQRESMLPEAWGF